jgi:MFS family permease
MSRKQLLALFSIGVVGRIVGNGLIPLLPVYAKQLGVEPAVMGYYLSFSYLALAAGAVLGGWLSDRLQRRKMLLILAGVVVLPAVWLMGRATNIWQLAVPTTIAWLLFGMAGALGNILAGLFAEESERGKVFGILWLTTPLGALIGGATIGPIADRWGYPTMFTAIALFLSLWPLAGLLVEDKVVVRVQRGAAETASERPGLGKGIYLLLLASTAATVANFVRMLATPLAMDELGFSAAAISGTVAASGAVLLPLTPLSGWLSDRVGRKRLLTFGYLLGAVGLAALAASVSLWHFWVAYCLVSVLNNFNNVVGSALVTDLVPQASLGRGMALFGASAWVGGIIGSTGAGQAIQQFGTTTTFILGAFLPLLAILLLLPIREARREDAAVKVAPA